MNVISARSSLHHPPKFGWLSALAEAGLLVAAALVLTQFIGT